MGSLRGLRLAAGRFAAGTEKLHLYETPEKHCPDLMVCGIDSQVPITQSTRNTDLKRINGFCTKSQESPKAPTESYRHRVPLHKPTDFEKKILLWSGRFKKEEEIPETISFEMLDAAKNKIRVKVSYLMIALTVAGCIYMVIEGKKAAKRHESLTSLNLERKARLREEAAMKAKTE
ncbi:Protein of unknown function DUF1075 containing protein [Cricetulus griseus]|nr:Protein of unknown function DUF1075 containing protein [Cricetulus griseus]